MLAEAVLCLSMAMYHEARSEPREAMRAVGDTVIYRMNASEKYDHTCDVVLARKQFTWTKKLNERSIFGLMSYQERMLDNIKQEDFEAYQCAEKLATKMVKEDYSPKYAYSHFYSGRPPYWAKGKPRKKIGKLYFLKGVK